MSRGPLPVELGRGGLRSLYLLGALGAAKAATLIVLAQSLATGITSVIAGTDEWHSAVAWGLAAAVGRSLASWAVQVVAARGAIGTKEALRADLADRVLAGGRFPVGSTTTLATSGLDELDNYFGSVLPALASAATIPLLVGARILFADWVSALIIVLTVPLIPVFMTLIGLHTRDRVDAASAALARLSDHLVELARGLPVLVGLGRVEEQSVALDRIADEHRKRTMVTLRTAFLSSLALELISTILVAVVAVFIGIRLISGDLGLEVGLLVLVLAPECFAPFRDLGAAFHASEDGLSALRSARSAIDSPRPIFVESSPGRLGVHALRVRYDDSSVAAVNGIDFFVERSRITALRGRSGSGKSTVLGVLAGVVGSGDGAVVSGTVAGVDPTSVAWMPQHPHTVADTVRGELALYAGDGAGARVGAGAAAAAVAGTAAAGSASSVSDSPRLDVVLSLLGLAHLAKADPAVLSPGELRRLAFGRVLLRVDAGAELVLLDEPTAHLDPASARIIEREIVRMRGRVTVIVASHEQELMRLADFGVLLGANSGAGAGAGANGDASVASAVAARAAGDPSFGTVSSAGRSAELTFGVKGVSSAERSRELTVGLEASCPAAAGFGQNAPATDRPTDRPGTRPSALLAGILRPSAVRLGGGILLAALAALFAAALTAVSAWLIVRAGEHPPIMYLLVAIVGVRFFGIGRSALRYAERLVTHDTVFRAAIELRARLWRGLAERGPSAKRMLRGGTTIDVLVAAVDRVRDLIPRVVAPPVIGLLAAVAAVIAVGLLHAPALPLLVACLLVCLLVGPLVAVRADRKASIVRATSRSALTSRFGSTVAAADELRANGLASRVRNELAELDAAAARQSRRVASALGLGGAIVVLACAATSVLMIAVAAPAVAAGHLTGEIVAVLAFLPLALLEPLLGVVDAAQQSPLLASTAARLSLLLPGLSNSTRSTRPPRPPKTSTNTGTTQPARPAESRAVESLELRGLGARWPDSDSLVFSNLDAEVRRGEWLVVTGPSGSGKSTLLTVLLGQLDPASGDYLLDGDAAAATPGGSSLVGRVAWCPQEAHLFDSTLRANLLLGRARDDAPTDAELVDVIERVGLGTVLRRSPLALDARIGSEGTALSGGERQRLAVARTLLSRAGVILLDEPTAHLDTETATDLLADLRRALADRIVVLVTHHAADAEPGDRHLQLGASGARVIESELVPA